MTRYRLVVVLVPALTVTFSCAGRPGAQDADADKVAIRLFIDQATELNRAGNAAAWVDMFADGGA